MKEDFDVKFEKRFWLDCFEKRDICDMYICRECPNQDECNREPINDIEDNYR